jgi:SAM-dependent methyltransferase
MTATTTIATGLDERLIGAAVQSLELLSIHLGRRLGLYRHLVHPRTVAELGVAAGIDRRYAREWLEQQAVAGLVTVDDPDRRWHERRYVLDDEQRAVLLSAADPSHVSPLADMVAGIAGVLDPLADAYRSGAGVPYAAYGSAFRDGQAGINRPAFARDLVTAWLAAVPDVRHRLLTDGGRVADLGCGAGWSTIALAGGLPLADVIGIDSDPSSIADAERNASDAGATVRFATADASSLASQGPFDLVLILEALHDMAKPVEVLEAARRSLAPGGAVLVADEKVAARFTAPGDELERMMYGWSVLACLPASLAESPSAGLGTVLRQDLVRRLAADAGLMATISDIDAGFFRLYVLR